jgi:predicted TIM-barrel enzyme
MDIVTSGPATGVAANISKIKNMKECVGDDPMAIASGVNVENKSVYSQYIDYLLVASSITDGTTELIIESKLKELL